MSVMQIKTSTLVLIILGVIIITAGLTLVSSLYFVTQKQPATSTPTPEATTKEVDVSDRIVRPSVTALPNTEIKNDADLQDALKEIDATDIDELDALLEQNDLDAASF